MTNSCEIAKAFGKQNKHVNESIRNLIRKNPELSKHFMEDLYVSKRGRCERQFKIDEIGVDILINKFQYNVRSARFEYKYLNEIKDFLDKMGISYIEQFHVNGFRVDLYIPVYNIAIEIDEKEHKYKKAYDLKRQNYIESQIHCKFIRVNEEDSCGSIMAIIVKVLNLAHIECA